MRAASETLWAEQQLAQARLAIEAQIEIDRAQLRHQVSAAPEGPTADSASAVDDIYLPIAAEAEAASLAAIQSPDAAETPAAPEAGNLPAIVEPRNTPATPSIPTIPDFTRAAARWVRPLVPGFVARAIDTTAHPLRTARQVIEEVEEITFSLKRTHRLTVHSDESSGIAPTAETGHSADAQHADFGAPAAQAFSPRSLPPESADVTSLMSSRGESRRELTERDGPAELRATDGPRQLPPGE